MKGATIVCGLLAMLGTSVVLWRQHSLNLRRNPENHFSSTIITNFENTALQEELIALREQTKELPKLRNEMGQLRTIRNDLTAARAENTRLIEARRNSASIPPEAPPGFTSKEQLKNAGFTTPEAAVETFFWAMRESRLDLMIDSLSPEHRDRQNFEALSATRRANQIESFQAEKMGNGRSHTFTDFTVADRQQISEDTIVLSLRSSTGANAAKFRLKRIGTEWKIEDIPL